MHPPGFPTQHRQGASLRAEIFIARLHRDWKKLKEDAESHQRTQYHLDADAKRQAFQTTSRNAMEQSDVHIQDASAELIRRNRSVLMSICRCLHLAGREGIALRGHRDDFGGKRESNKRCALHVLFFSIYFYCTQSMLNSSLDCQKAFIPFYAHVFFFSF